MVQNQDSVTAEDGVEAVGNDQRGTAFERGANSLL